MIRSDQKVAILLHGGILGVQGKTGLAMLRFSEAPIVAVIDRDAAGKSLPELTGISRSVPIVASIAEALAYQPDVLAIGIAPSGGGLPEEWRSEMLTALAAGLSIVNGLHTQMNADLEFTARLEPGQWIWDVRQEPTGLKVGSGAARHLDCLRVLTVGTDMSVGKMSTSLELDRASRSRGLRSKFLATGQAGIMISGGGIPLDAVRVDFAAGAVEQLVLQAAGGDPPPDILHIEGQGSLLNPASTATLPLIRGSQPTHLILVHRAGQTHIRTFPHVPIPSLSNVVPVYESIARAGGAFASVKVAAIALNTGHLDAAGAQAAIEQVAIDTGLPCADPVRQGAGILLEAVLSQAALGSP